MTTDRMRQTVRTRRRRQSRTRGQALVEFSLALIPFLLILMGIVDLGRGIYMSSGVTQAAREIARVTSVHPCNTATCSLGNSPETIATIATQQRLVPNLTSSSVTIACSTVSDATVTSTALTPCASGNFIRVTVSVPYTALTPILSMVAPQTLTSTAHIQVP
jgi:Flp pilus assembly protein TadG